MMTTMVMILISSLASETWINTFITCFKVTLELGRVSFHPTRMTTDSREENSLFLDFDGDNMTIWLLEIDAISGLP